MEKAFKKTPEQEKLLKMFQELVLEKNKVMNLTAITEEKAFYLRHFVDSAMLLQFTALKGRVLDLGTGAGFPGIPLAILCPDAEFVLMDALQKRIRFLEEAVAQLGLGHVRLIHSRAEDGARGPLRESFDFVVTRALAPLPVLLEYALPYLKVGGRLYAYKGTKIHEELEKSGEALKILGGSSPKLHPYTLEDHHYVLVEIKKIKGTPRMYPRNPGAIAKAPL